MLSFLTRQTTKIINKLPAGAAWEDADYMHDVRMATLTGANPAAYVLLWTIAILLAVFLVWAALASLDEVTRGMGKIVPSSRVQVIQNLEGGIVKKLLVQEGDTVEKGQELLQLDDTGFASSAGEMRARLLGLRAAVARLEAEVGNKQLSFPEDIIRDAPDIVAQQKALSFARQQEIDTTLATLRQQLGQRQQEHGESQARFSKSQRSWRLADEELAMIIPLERDGIVSKVEILRLRRTASELRGEMEEASLAVERAALAIKEVQAKMDEARAMMKREAQNELADKREEASRVSQILVGETDKVTRTTIRSPMKGVVKSLLVNTVGGVIQPGMDIMEIVPVEDTLLVEAEVKPQDIAFIEPGQPAVVKVTAYDFSIFGGLDGTLEHISADTTKDEDGNTFYTIKVRTDKNHLSRHGKSLPIIPGMEASVDILTGKKTVLSYLLKPFRKMQERALRER